MEFSKDDLAEAKRQIDSTLHKLRETIKTFESKGHSERYKSQIALAKRRVKAFEIANWFIERDVLKCIKHLSGMVSLQIFNSLFEIVGKVIFL